jgi:hypothetical protein
LLTELQNEELLGSIIDKFQRKSKKRLRKQACEPSFARIEFEFWSKKGERF